MRIFLLTCLLRGMTAYRFKSFNPPRFLLTCLLRGMTPENIHDAVSFIISTHMPLARHDQTLPRRPQWTDWFLLTCLLRGMTPLPDGLLLALRFLLTCLLRGMTIWLTSAPCQFSISTHMPLARHDRHLCGLCNEIMISTHMPLARHDAGFRYWYFR